MAKKYTKEDIVDLQKDIDNLYDKLEYQRQFYLRLLQEKDGIITKAINVCLRDKETIWLDGGPYIDYFDELLETLKGVK